MSFGGRVLQLEATLTFLREQGYVEIPTSSGVGTRVLVHNELRRVAKINFDPAYDHFVRMCVSWRNLHEDYPSCLPRIYSHESGVSPVDDGSEASFSVILLELLVEVEDAKGQQIYSWMLDMLAWLRSPEDVEKPDDPFLLASVFQRLYQFSEKFNIGIDHAPGNVMRRMSNDLEELVFVDPFHGNGI
jgi:hypothetical protein